MKMLFDSVIVNDDTLTLRTLKDTLHKRGDRMRRRMRRRRRMRMKNKVYERGGRKGKEKNCKRIISS